MSEAENIAVLPKLAGARHNSKRPVKPATVEEVAPADPDVEYILKNRKKNSMNVLNMKHEPTAEETAEAAAEPKPAVTTQWNWLVITLAVIVFVLIVVIVWYVLKENTPDDAANKMKLPASIVMPNAMPNLRMPPQPQNLQGMPQQMCPIPPVQAFQTSHQNQLGPPMSSRPVIATPTTQNRPAPKLKPTKNELENTLKKLETIEENKVANSGESVKSGPPVEENSDEDLDNQLSSKFYSNLEKQIEIEEASSDDDTNAQD